MHESLSRGIIYHKGSDGHNGEHEQEHECSHAIIVSINAKGEDCWTMVFIDVKKHWLSLMSIDVMVVFGEVSKVVPLWHSSKNVPHGKTL
jgi:hypothetical protein